MELRCGVLFVIKNPLVEPTSHPITTKSADLPGVWRAYATNPCPPITGPEALRRATQFSLADFLSARA